MGTTVSLSELISRSGACRGSIRSPHGKSWFLKRRNCDSASAKTKDPPTKGDHPPFSALSLDYTSFAEGAKVWPALNRVSEASFASEQRVHAPFWGPLSPNLICDSFSSTDSLLFLEKPFFSLKYISLSPFLWEQGSGIWCSGDPEVGSLGLHRVMLGVLCDAENRTKVSFMAAEARQGP